MASDEDADCDNPWPAWARLLHDGGPRSRARPAGGRPPCLPLRAAVSSPSCVDSRMDSRSVSAIAAKSANSNGAAPWDR